MEYTPDVCGGEAISMPLSDKCDECEQFRTDLERLSALVDMMQLVLDEKQDALTPGEGITIDDQNVISAERNASNTYTKEEVDDLIASIKTSAFEEVDSLPATGETNIIYMVPNAQTGWHDLYIWDAINEEWIPVGKDSLDLTGYVKTTDLNTVSKDGLVLKGTGAANLVWKTDGSGNPAWRPDANTTYGAATTAAAGLMSAADKSKLDHLGLLYSAKKTITSNSSGVVGASITLNPGLWWVNGHTYTANYGGGNLLSELKLGAAGTGSSFGGQSGCAHCNFSGPFKATANTVVVVKVTTSDSRSVDTYIRAVRLCN